MHTFVILLRGVTPSGKNKVPMAQLREALTGAGFSDVRTYIQSGNAIVTTDLPSDKTAQLVHDVILKEIGADLAVIVRTADELKQALARLPFTAGHDPARVFVAYLAEAPDAGRVSSLLSQDFGDEKLAIIGQTAYMYIPGAYGRGKLSNNFIEKQLGVAATMRNLNTTKKVIEMASHE